MSRLLLSKGRIRLYHLMWRMAVTANEVSATDPIAPCEERIIRAGRCRSHCFQVTLHRSALPHWGSHHDRGRRNLCIAYHHAFLA